MATGTTFDPYYRWLGIPPQEQPPHHYRLLAIALFEDNAEVIESAADQRMAYVRTFQAGPYSALSQQVLNELSAARVCLLKPEKKTAYDRELRAKLASLEPAAAVIQFEEEPESVPFEPEEEPEQTFAPADRYIEQVVFPSPAAARAFAEPPSESAATPVNRLQADLVAQLKRFRVPVAIAASAALLLIIVVPLVRWLFGGEADGTAKSTVSPERPATQPIVSREEVDAATSDIEPSAAEPGTDDEIRSDPRILSTAPNSLRFSSVLGAVPFPRAPDFLETAPHTRLVGFRYTLQDNGSWISAIQAIYEKQPGRRILGKQYGAREVRGITGIEHEIATRPGYVIAGVTGHSEASKVRALQLLCVRFGGVGEGIIDQYQTSMVGTPSGELRQLGDEQAIAEGIFGATTHDGALLGFGLLEYSRGRGMHWTSGLELPVKHASSRTPHASTSKECLTFPSIIDDCDVGYWEEGEGWGDLARASGCFRNTARYAFSSSADAQAHWDFQGLGEGEYRVFMTWKPAKNNPNSLYATINGESFAGGGTIDGNRPPRPDVLVGAQLFEEMAIVEPRGGRVDVSVRGAHGPAVDAVMLLPTFRMKNLQGGTETPIATQFDTSTSLTLAKHPGRPLSRLEWQSNDQRYVDMAIIDDGDEGYSEIGERWQTSNEGGWNGQFRELREAYPVTAQWAFEKLNPEDEYTLFLSIPKSKQHHFSRYEVFDSLAPLAVTHTTLPAAVIDNSTFLKLGEFRAKSGTLIVRVAPRNYEKFADAAMVIRSAKVSEYTSTRTAETVTTTRTSPAVVPPTKKLPLDPIPKFEETPPLTEETVEEPAVTEAEPGVKVPPPGAVAYQAAQAEIRLKLAAQLAKDDSPKEKLALIDALLDFANENTGELRYVALDEAAQRAMQMKAGARAFDALRRMHEDFKFDVLAKAREWLRELAQSGAFVGSRKELIGTVCRMAEALAIEGKRKDAETLLADCERVASKSSDPKLPLLISDTRAWIHEATGKQGEIEEAIKAAAKSPSSELLNLRAGKLLCLVSRDWQRGLPFLAKGGAASNLALAATAELKETPDASNVLELWWRCARNLAGSERTAVLLHAGDWCDRIGTTNSGVSADEMLLILKDLESVGYVVTERPAKPKRVIRTTRARGKTGANKVGSGKIQPSEPNAIRGNLFGGKNGTPYQDLARNSAILVGFDYTLHGNQWTSKITPIYKTADDGRRSGDSFGNDSYGGQVGVPGRIVARDGYAIGGLVGYGSSWVYGFEVVFMKINGKRLDPTDSYRSSLIGQKMGSTPIQLGGDGRPVVGINGYVNGSAEIYSIGLIQE